jgi:hypothetical protein
MLLALGRKNSKKWVVLVQNKLFFNNKERASSLKAGASY